MRFVQLARVVGLVEAVRNGGGMVCVQGPSPLCVVR